MIFPRKFAWQVELICFEFVLHVSGRRQFKRGMCREPYFFVFLFCGMFEPKMFLHVLFQTNLKPNDSDVEHSSHVKHSFFCEALAYAKHRF